MRIIDKANKMPLQNMDIQTVKGTTKIELYNPTTRIKKVFRDENTFQSANIAKWLANLGDNNIKPYGNQTFTAAPWKCIVGGLLLFRDTITVGSQFMPAGNKMTGKAAVDVANLSTPRELGSYNEQESAISASALTQVYDFTTSQANGDINCVCLTSREGGLVGYGNSSGERYTGATTDFGFYGKEIDISNSEERSGIFAENGRRYFVTADSTDIIVNERKAIALQNTSSIFAGQTTQYNFAKSGYNEKYNTDAFYYYYIGNNKIAIIAAGYGDVTSGGTLYYLEFDCSAHTLTQKTLVNSASVTISIGSGYNPGTKSYFTRTGKFVTCGTENVGGAWIYYPIMFDLSTGVVDFSGKDLLEAERTKGCLCVGSDLFIYNKHIIDLQNDTVYPIDTNGLTGWGGGAYGRTDPSGDFADGYFQIGCGNQGYHISKLIANPLYLATINNLDNTVTKTAAQTMKVTYTLTEV